MHQFDITSPTREQQKSCCNCKAKSFEILKNRTSLRRPAIDRKIEFFFSIYINISEVQAFSEKVLFFCIEHYTGSILPFGSKFSGLILRMENRWLIEGFSEILIFHQNADGFYL